MTIHRHPAFSNPTIQEALCEIHFQMPRGESWQPALFNQFFRHVEHEFPEMEPMTEAGLQFQLKSGRVEFLPPKSRIRYKHGSRPLLLQLSDTILTVNMLPKYAGWIQLEQDIQQAWAWAQQVIHPAGITRIGLRYINFIVKDQPDERAGDWLAPNEFIASAALTSLSSFLSRVEVRLDTERRSIVTLAETSEDGNSQLVLDIDCIAESTRGAYLLLEDRLTALHDRVWEIFVGFLTPRYQKRLEGGST
jgi:uncharacterized protein (TIGR04255 family)